MKPIIVILGPSGVGKTDNSQALKKGHSFLHLDFEKGFQANGFPAEWDKDIGKINFANLSIVVCSRLSGVQYAGAVLSFPTDRLFSPQQLKDASLVGIIPVVLWGSQKHCLEARRKRQMESNIYAVSGDL